MSKENEKNMPNWISSYTIDSIFSLVEELLKSLFSTGGLHGYSVQSNYTNWRWELERRQPLISANFQFKEKVFKDIEPIDKCAKFFFDTIYLEFNKDCLKSVNCFFENIENTIDKYFQTRTIDSFILYCTKALDEKNFNSLAEKAFAKDEPTHSSSSLSDLYFKDYKRDNCINIIDNYLKQVEDCYKEKIVPVKRLTKKVLNELRLAYEPSSTIIKKAEQENKDEENKDDQR